MSQASLLLLALVLLSACSSYSPSRSYTPGYTLMTSTGHYHTDYVYYGSYQPGWFVAAPYFPGNYWGFGAMVYWPTYASSYYYSNHYYSGQPYYGRYYPYSDPWYYPYSGHSRHVYGHYYGPYNSPYYGYGAAYGSWYRPYLRGSYSGGSYSGGSHSYRPPGRQGSSRPDPVVIPRDQRGGRGSGAGYNDRVDEGLRERNRFQPERRSTTVVAEREGISRSVGVAPGTDGSQGMVISNRSERKIQPSRLHPVAPDGSSRAYRVPESGNIPPVVVQPGTARPEPVYRQQLDTSRVNPGVERGQPRNIDRGQRRDRDRDRDRQ